MKCRAIVPPVCDVQVTGATGKDGLATTAQHPLYPCRFFFATLPSMFQVGELVHMVAHYSLPCLGCPLGVFDK